MKSIVFLFSAMMLEFTGYNTTKFSEYLVNDKEAFKLTYITVGFGQNTYEMQPAFSVKGTKFVYTYEEMWGLTGKKLRCDTLLIGDFRVSSIDSISDLIKGIKDTVIHKTNIHSLGGSERAIEVSNAQKKIRFQLFNTSDTIADKIIAILNSYMSGEKEMQQIIKYRE